MRGRKVLWHEKVDGSTVLAQGRSRLRPAVEYSGPDSQGLRTDRDWVQYPDSVRSIYGAKAPKQNGKSKRRGETVMAKARKVHTATRAFHIVIPGLALIGTINFILYTQGVL